MGELEDAAAKTVFHFSQRQAGHWTASAANSTGRHRLAAWHPGTDWFDGAVADRMDGRVTVAGERCGLDHWTHDAAGKFAGGHMRVRDGIFLDSCTATNLDSSSIFDYHRIGNGTIRSRRILC